MINNNTQTNSTIICISKKHFSAYILPVFFLLFGLILATAYTTVGLIIAGLSLLRILENKTTKWILCNDKLVVKFGFLPLRKTFMEVPFHDIFEAFYTKDFLSTIFGSATIAIRRTDGSTSGFVYRGMSSYKKMTSEINQIIRSLKANPSNGNGAKNNLLDDLQKLSLLKEQGVFSDDEFEQMKQKLIG